MALTKHIVRMVHKRGGLILRDHTFQNVVMQRGIEALRGFFNNTAGPTSLYISLLDGSSGADIFNTETNTHDGANYSGIAQSTCDVDGVPEGTSGLAGAAWGSLPGGDGFNNGDPFFGNSWYETAVNVDLFPEIPRKIWTPTIEPWEYEDGFSMIVLEKGYELTGTVSWTASRFFTDPVQNTGDAPPWDYRCYYFGRLIPGIAIFKDVEAIPYEGGDPLTGDGNLYLPGTDPLYVAIDRSPSIDAWYFDIDARNPDPGGSSGTRIKVGDTIEVTLTMRFQAENTDS